MAHASGTGRMSTRLGVFYTLLGAVFVVALLFVALANNGWVVLYAPSLPWQPTPPVPLVEVRLWGAMLVSFILGALVCGIVAVSVIRAKNARSKRTALRLKALEIELDNVNRLVAATRQSPETVSTQPME
ncbi:MAG: hypothetical protein QNJ97_15050 [Myxococcota bacterium]|nr:hypothetical protein [Myxococcota bacterium]